MSAAIDSVVHCSYILRQEMYLKELAETSALPNEPDWARIQNFTVTSTNGL